MNENETIVNINGQDAVMFSVNAERKLAVVDLEVLRQLTELLQSADFHEVIKNHKYNLESVSNIADAIQVSEDFVAFHKTVNLITEYTCNPKGVIDLENNY